MLLIRDPGLLVDEGQPPAGELCAREMVKPRHRAIVDVEGQPLLDQAPHCKTDRRLDGTAVTDRDDIPAGLRLRDAIDRSDDTVIEVHETFATGRRFIDIGEPTRAGRTRS